MAKATSGALLALILLTLLASGAHAQLGPVDPAVTLQLDATAVDLDAGNVTSVNATVTNTGSLDGGVVLTLAGVPEGWTVTVQPNEFPLTAGSSQPVVITLAAPAAATGAATGSVDLDATLSGTADRTATASGTLAVTRVDPIVPAPPPPPYALYASLAGIGVALVAGIVGFLLWRRRAARLAVEKAAADEAARAAAHAAWLARETGIGITLLEGPVQYGSRRELVYRVQVENVSDRERVAVIDVARCPPGWAAAAGLPKAHLRPGERVIVAFHVNPNDVPGGTVASFAFSAKPEEAQERDERIELDVTAPVTRVPEARVAYTPGPTEPAAARPALRR